MARRLHVNTASISNSELLRIAKKCGFSIFHGAKHDKIKTADGRFVTLIPRHSTISRSLVKSIIEALNSNGAEITFT